MSFLQQLLEEYCPDGVEHKKLSEIATDMFRGSGITRNQVTTEGTPCVRYGEIYTDYNIFFDKCNSHTNAEEIQNKKYFEYGDILFAITGESVEDIAKSCAYVGKEKCLAGGDIVVMKHNQDPKYIAYALETTNSRMQKSKGRVKSKVVHSSVPAILNIEIPIPPLPVQQEIVRILDRFTELTADLTAELAAELAARKKQYEYYREKMFTFNSDTEWKPLESLFPFIRNGFVGVIKPYFTSEENGVRYLEGTNIHDGKISDNEILYVTKEFHAKHIKNELKSDDILMVQSGHIGECAVVGDKYSGANCHALIIMSNGGYCNSRFYVHYFHTYQGFKSLTPAMTGGTVKHVLAKKVSKIMVPIIPIDEQNKIVKALDNYERICMNITDDLPAEIEARQKQYEYYRDKLLTFKRKEA